MEDQLVEHFCFHSAESICVDAVQDDPKSEVVFDSVEIQQGPPIAEGECKDALLAMVGHPSEDQTTMKLIAEDGQRLVSGVGEVGEPPRLTPSLRCQVQTRVVPEIGSHTDWLDGSIAAQRGVEVRPEVEENHSQSPVWHTTLPRNLFSAVKLEGTAPEYASSTGIRIAEQSSG